MKTLKLLKNDILFFELVSNFDGNNTCKAFKRAFIVRKNKRLYLSLMNLKEYKENVCFTSYADYSNDVKQFLNSYHGFNIRYMSEFPNIIVSGSEVSRKEFNKICK